MMAKNDYKFIVAETANHGFKWFKCIQMHIPQKGQKNAKNGKKWQTMLENYK